jgi:hypothetical protein
MATTQYTGARYVPLFADPLEWDDKREFEPLTIVLHKGASYTSRQYVPKGIDILNEEFWALTGNYNAQVEQYRTEVLTYNDRINKAQGSADKAQKDVADFEQTFSSKFPLKTDDLGDGIVTAAKLAADSVTEPKIADGSVTAAKLAADSVTEPKIADGSVSGAKLAADSVTEPKIADGSVSAAKLAANSVAESNLQYGSVSAAKIKAGAINSDVIVDAAVTSAKIAAGAVGNDKLAANSVASGNIQDGSITAPKLNKTAANSILNGFTVRRFDASDSSADNEGLVAPASSHFDGFYIEELGILVINKISVGGTAWSPSSNTFKLPNYVPRPNKELQICEAGVLVWTRENYFKSWWNLKINTDGYVYPGGVISASDSNSTMGVFIVYMKPYSTGAGVTSDIYGSYAGESGVI